jgi:uncharacterized repeat protein (TIGR01451 family)
VIPEGQEKAVTFTITVTNRGPDIAQNVAMSYTPTVFVGVTATASAGVSCATPPPNGFGTTTCTTPSLGRGGSMKIKLQGKVLLFYNQCELGKVATASSATPDPNLNNNTAEVIIRSSQPRCQ